MMLALRPQLVRMEQAEAGYTGDLATGVQQFFQVGVHAVAENGVFGDPRRASPTAGDRYIERLVEVIVSTVEGEKGS